MKKFIFSILFMFIASGFTFGQQNYRDYILLTQYTTIPKTAQKIGTDRRDPTKYAVTSLFSILDNLLIKKPGNTVILMDHYADGGSMFIEMTLAQEQELKKIQERKDEALILFTKVNKPTIYKTNTTQGVEMPYTLVTEKIIPLEEIWGIKYSQRYELVENFWKNTTNLYEVIRLYLDTGKTDADGRIAKNLKN
jgi:hypothetical protein